MAAILADNQARIANALDAIGATVNLGWSRDLTTKRLAGQLADLITDWEVRNKLSKTGKSLVDGLGAKRVIKSILER
jgi:spore coat polysaccharide biosynthesis predicted glycosyltransferase SpsG